MCRHCSLCGRTLDSSASCSNYCDRCRSYYCKWVYRTKAPAGGKG